MMHLRPAIPADVPFLRDLESRVMHDHALTLWGRLIPPPHPSAFDLVNTRIITLAGDPAGFVMVKATARALPLRLSVLRPNHRALAFYLREGLAVTEQTDGRILLTRPPPEYRADTVL